MIGTQKNSPLRTHLAAAFLLIAQIICYVSVARRFAREAMAPSRKPFPSVVHRSKTEEDHAQT